MKNLSHYDVRQIAQIVLIVAGSAQLIAGGIWVIWILRAYRRDVKRSREGLCMGCGYDLRHSKERCPECGTPLWHRSPGTGNFKDSESS